MQDDTPLIFVCYMSKAKQQTTLLDRNL